VAFDSLDALEWLRKHLEQDDPDLLREMVKSFAEQLMSAEANAICGAGYGERSAERVNSRNGYRHRDFDTRAGTVDLAVPKLREGSYFPGWLLEPRRRAERALTQVVGPLGRSEYLTSNRSGHKLRIRGSAERRRK
jgi:putative transposase